MPKDVNRICGDAGGNEKLFFCREFCVQFSQRMMEMLTPSALSAPAADAGFATIHPSGVQDPSRPLVLLGCPGSGKTLMSWAFSLLSFLRLGLSILFVLVDFGIIQMAHQSITQLQPFEDVGSVPDKAIDMTPGLFRSLVKSGLLKRVDILIIDGVQLSNVNEWIRACCGCDIAKIRLFSSSVGAFAGNQTQQDFRVEYCYQPSWTWEEYIAACQVPAIKTLLLKNCQLA